MVGRGEGCVDDGGTVLTAVSEGGGKLASGPCRVLLGMSDMQGEVVAAVWLIAIRLLFKRSPVG